jgi:hypothetical protein
MLIIPIVLELVFHRRLIAKFFYLGAYFFFFTFLHAITAFGSGQYEFLGDQFIGWIVIMGLRFPIEDIVFWVILFSMGIITYYEFFDDDEK